MVHGTHSQEWLCYGRNVKWYAGQKVVKKTW
jgi:hypothetical protein